MAAKKQENILREGGVEGEGNLIHIEEDILYLFQLLY